MSAILDAAYEAVLQAQEGTCGRCGRQVVLALTTYRAWVVIERDRDGPYGLWLDDEGRLRTGPDVIEGGGWAPHIKRCDPTLRQRVCSVPGCVNRGRTQGLCNRHRRDQRAAEEAVSRR